MAQQKAQLEVALLQAQVANEQAKAQENTADIALKEAKTRNLESKSDMEDLNFVEQESGVNRQHEENMKGVDQNNELDKKFADAIINEPNLNR
jgi:hypothetical protein